MSFTASDNKRTSLSWLSAWWSLQKAHVEGGYQWCGSLAFSTGALTQCPQAAPQPSGYSCVSYSTVLCKVGLGMVFRGWWCGKSGSESLNDLFGSLYVLNGGETRHRSSLSCRDASLRVHTEGSVRPAALHFEAVRGQTSVSHCCPPSLETEAYASVLINNWWTREGASARSEPAFQ